MAAGQHAKEHTEFSALQFQPDAALYKRTFARNLFDVRKQGRTGPSEIGRLNFMPELIYVMDEPENPFVSARNLSPALLQQRILNLTHERDAARKRADDAELAAEIVSNRLRGYERIADEFSIRIERLQNELRAITQPEPHTEPE